MRKILGILLLTLPLFADPRTVLRMRDGSTHELKPTPPRGHIVEFREAPLVGRGSRAIASYNETFARFRRDLGEVRARGPRANAETRITHEFHRVFHGAAVKLEESELARVRALPYVKAVHVDEPVEAFASDDVPYVTRIGADRIWSEKKTRGAGIVVAVIDTGVDANHPSLAGKVIGGFDFVTGDEDPSDENGHGTHVAGIIAGEGEGVQGVAPDVKLLSYRVLDADGSGSASNIIMALEWAADPNQDDDFSDHADVANLSLGSRAGSADSPTSLAADRAVQAGVVVVLSAGNTFGGLTIGSPASSRLSITVGATDANDRMTFWSSRGPAFPDLAIKPEISAPGNEIVSAKMGGGTIVKSGTSMAAPHVAGAAALLLALHPDWTPAQIKAALVANADAVDEEVMARGGGRLNVYNASAPAIAIEPATLTFGNGTPGGWTKSRTVRVTNHASATRTFTATTSPLGGATLAIEPPTFTLDAGASRDVALTVTIAPNAKPSAFTFSLGGNVTFETSGASARLPWAAIDAARANVTYDAPDSNIMVLGWVCNDANLIWSRYEGDGRWATLLPYRRCGFTVVSNVWFGPDFGKTSMLFETHDVAGDLQLQRSSAGAVHKIRLAGVDRDGVPIKPTSFESTPYAAQYSLKLPENSLIALDSVLTSTEHPLNVNTIDDATILASQILFDFPRNRVVAVNHQPVHGGVHGDMTIASLPSDLRHVRVNVAPQPERFPLQPAVASSSNGQPGGWMGGGGFSIPQGWRGDVYVSPAASEDTWMAPAFGTGWLRLPDVETDLWTEGIRWLGGRFVMANELVPSPIAYSVAPGETLRIGDDPLHARARVEASDSAFSILYAFYGPAGEYSGATGRGVAYELRDASGALLREGTAEIPLISMPGSRGAYRATLRSAKSGTEVGLSFDTAREDSNPPALTSLRILDGDGAITTAVAPGESAALAFSVDEAATARAWWRAGEGEWQPLTVALNGEMHRAELPTNVFGGVDVRVELEDASGNIATTTIDDAYSVGAKRRALRR